MHGTVLVFFVLTGGLSGTFANFLIPLQIGARDMASPFLNMLSYWFFWMASVVMITSLFIETGPAAGGWTSYPPLSALGDASLGSKSGMDYWITAMALFVVSPCWGVELYNHYPEHAYQGYEHDETATDDLGDFIHGYTGCTFFPRTVVRINFIVIRPSCRYQFLSLRYFYSVNTESTSQ